MGIVNEVWSKIWRGRGLWRLPIRTLAWSDRQSWDSLLFKWQGIRKPPRLVLSASLRRKLAVEHWRALLTYYSLSSTPKRRLYVILPFAREMLPVVLFMASTIVLSFAFGRFASALFSGTVGPLVLGFFIIRLGQATRRVFLRADTIAAESLGRQKLLDCFETIDRLQLPEVENGKRRVGWAARLWPTPSITQRVENLRKMRPD